MAALWLQSVSLLVLLVVWWPGTQAVTTPQHLCNSDLVEALHLVCGERGFFFNPKRDVGPQRGVGGGSQLAQFTFSDQMEMLAKRGVLEECCHNPCSILTLENYCN